MKIIVTVLVGGMIALFVVVGRLSLADEPTIEYAADDYVICSACHLPDGVGIPGVFPPIRNRVSSIAKIEGGRAYLITAISFGLMGNIEVAGMPYFGVMAGNSGMLSSNQIANALNYAVFELSDGDVTDVLPFTNADVIRVQSETLTKGPGAAAELRKKIVEAAGDQWP
ncbi:MAG: hypothetical protein HOI35_10050 [Woeseia sp.]|jgi:hypothetical protein|nr:hypothetical protein [Woeseia sp.]MBT6210350.1 hypothetical protein [Woeseia sp.]